MIDRLSLKFTRIVADKVQKFELFSAEKKFRDKFKIVNGDFITIWHGYLIFFAKKTVGKIFRFLFTLVCLYSKKLRSEKSRLKPLKLRPLK